MEAVIACALCAIAGILFYRVVERRHKVLVGKTLLGIAVLAAAGTGILFAWAQQQSRRERALQRSIEITFVRDTSVRNPFLPGYVRSDTVASATFNLCNRWSDTVAAVRFTPKALIAGRSTEYDLRVTRGLAFTDQQLTSDVILAPHQCTSITWPGAFIPRDTVVVRYVSVRLLES